MYTRDTEKSSQPPEYLEGFAEFAQYLGSSSELALFRRFDVVSTRNLLYLQAQLLSVEAQLEHQDDLDMKVSRLGGDESMKVLLAAKDWASFRLQSKEDDIQNAKMETVMELRKLMKEYREFKSRSGAPTRHNT